MTAVQAVQAGKIILTDGDLRIRDTNKSNPMYPYTVDRWYSNAQPEPRWMPIARFVSKNDAFDFAAMKTGKKGR